MDWSGIIGGAISTAGSLYASAQNIASAREQMAFQERMTKNRHQYEVEDLKKAGLNPILSANSGASVPSGAQAHIENPGESAIRGFSAAQQAKIARDQLALQASETESRIQLNSAQAAKNLSEAKDLDLKNATEYWPSQSFFLGSSAQEKQHQIGLIQSNIKRIDQEIFESQARVKRMEEEVSVLQSQVRHYEQQIKESKSRQVSIAADARLSDARSRLTAAEEALTEEKKWTQRYLTGIAAYEEKLLDLEMPKARNEARYQESTFGKWFEGNFPNLPLWRRK